MVLRIIPTLRKLPINEQVRLLGSLRSYITDDNLINILQNYDYNNKSNDSMLNRQLLAFSGNPKLKDQITIWLNS